MKLWSAERKSLFSFLRDLAHANGGVLTDSSVALPDEEAPEPGGVRWAPGALDGVMGHHMGHGDPNSDRVLEATRSAASRRSEGGFERLYTTLLEEDCLPIIDTVIEHVVGDPRIDRRRLRVLMSFIARRSPHRGPAKFALAILGAIGRKNDDQQVFATFGLHDEFALYAVVALLRSADDPEDAVWSVAKATTGWGRIAAVERLADTARPEIRRWLLREGYKNQIMYEYIALVCAESGGLADELSRPVVDDEVRRCAAELLGALLADGPVWGISKYAEASRAFHLYVDGTDGTSIDPHTLWTLLAIRDYLDSLPNEPGERLDVWTVDERRHCLAHVNALLVPQQHSERLRREIATGDSSQMFWAESTARKLGLDVWAEVFARLESDPLAAFAPWGQAMTTDDGDRVEAVVNLAEQVLALDRLASGPALDLMPVQNGVQHHALDSILQDLHNYHGLGSALIRAALRSPVVRNRNMALKALSGWPPDLAAADWTPLLEAAYAAEPHPEVKARIERLQAARSATSGTLSGNGKLEH